MRRCILTFRSTHDAIRAEHVLAAEGIRVTLRPVPRRLGFCCGVCVEFPCNQEDLVLRLVREKGCYVSGIHQIDE